MTRSRSIAVAQTCPRKGDIQANLDEHIRLARLAATEGAQVVVFPELSLIGYELALADGLAFSENDPRLSSLLDLAASQGMTLVVGAPVRLESSLYWCVHPFPRSDYQALHEASSWGFSGKRTL